MSRLFTKSVSSEVIDSSDSDRTIKAYVAVYGNRDNVGDIMHPGSFRKTLTERKADIQRGKIPAKYNHELLVGSVVDASEDSHGLLATLKFMDDPQSDRIYKAVKGGFLPTFSFKYGIPDGGSKMVREGGTSTRHLTEVELYEAGPVDPDLAANDATHVYGAKGLMELAGAMSSLNALDCDERWARQAIEGLTDEERTMLAKLSGILEKLGGAARSLMLESATGDASSLPEGEDESEEYEGKAVGAVVATLRNVHDRFILGEIVETFSGLPARIRAAGQ